MKPIFRLSIILFFALAVFGVFASKALPVTAAPSCTSPTVITGGGSFSITTAGTCFKYVDSTFVNGGMFSVMKDTTSTSDTVQWYGGLDQNATSCANQTSTVSGNGGQLNNFTIAKDSTNAMYLSITGSAANTVTISIQNWQNGTGCSVKPTPLGTSTGATATTAPTKTNTPSSATNTPAKTSTPTGATNTFVPPTATAAKTNTPAPTKTATAVPTKTNTPSGPTATSSGSLPPWPTATASIAVSATIKVSGTFDGGMQRYYGTGTLGTSGQSESQSPIFELSSGSTIKNVILGNPAADGIHCDGSCVIQNVWWEDVGEDAATFRGSSSSLTYLVDGGGALHASDKVFQHNGAGTLTIQNFQVGDFGKLYRSCGNCSTQYQRHAIIRNVVATAPGLTLAGVNTNYGDVVTLSQITIIGDSSMSPCWLYTGNNTGAEPVQTGSGANGVNCIYSPSDITYK